MKVLQIITKGEAGGAQTHLLEICRALRGQVELMVVIGGTEPGGMLEARLGELGVAQARLPPMVNSLSPWRVLRAAQALRRILRQARPDVIHRGVRPNAPARRRCRNCPPPPGSGAR